MSTGWICPNCQGSNAPWIQRCQCSPEFHRTATGASEFVTGLTHQVTGARLQVGAVPRWPPSQHQQIDPNLLAQTQGLPLPREER